jgi:hypothetical protein
VPRQDTGSVRNKGIETRIVESLAHVLARGDHDPLFLAWNRSQTLVGSVALLLAYASAQDNDVANYWRE